MKKIIQIISVIVVSYFIFFLLRTNLNNNIPPVPMVFVNVVESNGPVSIPEASARGGVVSAIIVNDSDVPITLINTELFCDENIPKELVFAQRYDKQKGRYVPVEIKIGEAKKISANAGYSITEGSTCFLELKSWSKYGVEK